MAESPSHKFGQIIGNLLEAIVLPLIDNFCHDKSLYLDYKNKKRKARRGKKLIWTDSYGNAHDLDYVIEKDGSNEIIGRPVAFIECAWRRYTKHSRNKAQEIQGAILPLAEKYKWMNPFLGTILAGVFTKGSLEQLRSLGFHILFFPYDMIVSSFASKGINIAFNEETPDDKFASCVKMIESAPAKSMESIKRHLIKQNQSAINIFLSALNERLERIIDKIIIIPLYGRVSEFKSVENAFSFLEGHEVYEGSGDFRKYEIIISFSNGDKVEASFASKKKAKEFLEFVSTQ
ncbi:MAG: DNA methylase [Candidatus Anammoxibacter sp.]